MLCTLVNLVLYVCSFKISLNMYNKYFMDRLKVHLSTIIENKAYLTLIHIHTIVI